MRTTGLNILGDIGEIIWRCKFFKTCKDYNSKSLVCRNNNLARNYYGFNKPCGCYREHLINTKNS